MRFTTPIMMVYVAIVFSVFNCNLMVVNGRAMPTEEDKAFMFLADENEKAMYREKLLENPTNDTETDERMEKEGEWVQSAPPEEIEEAKHSLDWFHFDLTLTKSPLMVTSFLFIITIAKSTLRLRYMKEIPESVALMFYGVAFAVILVRGFGVNPGQLDYEAFFMVFLPAIVSDAAYGMDKKNFFKSMPKITLFAVLGTIIHGLLLTITLFLLESYFGFAPGFLHLYMFSNLISAVDPVAVLSTFTDLDVKKDLFTLIFGESLCNDAVTIVLYRTIFNVIKASDTATSDPTILGTIGDCALQFLQVCTAGFLIGLIVGIIGVYLMKISVGHQHNQPIFALCCPYFAYITAESFHYSGIIGLVTCAGFMSFYTHNNMCFEMEFATIYFSKTAASLSEACIFFFLGISLVTTEFAFDFWFVVSVIVGCTLYRLVMVSALSGFHNIFVSKAEYITIKDQIAVSHAGIRGAVCFGLVQIIDERYIPAKPYFVTATLIMIFWTSIVQGCTIKKLMEWLQIPGDSGIEAENGKAYKFLSNFNKKYLKRYMTSKKGNYSPTDETFKHLCLPKAVSTALRIGERSQTDLTRHGQVSTEPIPPVQVSVGRPTIGPYALDLNLDDAPISTGRRTPVARNASRYSRHFIYSTAASDPESNYLTAPVSSTKRPTFDPHLLYNNQCTVSHPGDVERTRIINRRHNSMCADSVELQNLAKGLDKKHSRTVLSGNKKFVVNPEDLINEDREESPSNTTTKKATFEDDVFTKIDE